MNFSAAHNDYLDPDLHNPEDPPHLADHLAGLVEKLRLRVQELEKDKARLDLLDKHWTYLEFDIGPHGFANRTGEMDLRQVIDTLLK